MDVRGIESQPILVVHDDPEALAPLAERLTQLGHSVTTAGSGADALDRAAEVRPAVVLLKAALPDVHGFEVCRRLKEKDATRRAEVIFLARRREDLDRMRGLDLGGMDYLTEPVDDVALIARVNTALRLAQRADPPPEAIEKDTLTGLWSRDYFEAELQRE